MLSYIFLDIVFYVNGNLHKMVKIYFNYVKLKQFTYDSGHLICYKKLYKIIKKNNLSCDFFFIVKWLLFNMEENNFLKHKINLNKETISYMIFLQKFNIVVKILYEL